MQLVPRGHCNGTHLQTAILNECAESEGGIPPGPLSLRGHSRVRVAFFASRGIAGTNLSTQHMVEKSPVNFLLFTGSAQSALGWVVFFPARVSSAGSEPPILLPVPTRYRTSRPQPLVAPAVSPA